MDFTLEVQGYKTMAGMFDPPPVFIPPVIKNRVGIIKSLPDHFADPRDSEVNVTALQDNFPYPKSVLKGDKITVYPSIMRHMKKIQSAEAYDWTVRPFMLWINRNYIGDSLGGGDDPDPLPRCECINAYGNFVEIIGEVNGFYLLKALSNQTNFDQFDTSYNWFNYPTQWVKQSARNKKIPPDIFNVGDGFDAYFPMIKEEPNLWIYSGDVELLPPSPDGGYILQGMSVYTAGMQPLRLARKPGELLYPTAGWSIQTRGVIPARI